MWGYFLILLQPDSLISDILGSVLYGMGLKARWIEVSEPFQRCSGLGLRSKLECRASGFGSGTSSLSPRSVTILFVLLEFWRNEGLDSDSSSVQGFGVGKCGVVHHVSQNRSRHPRISPIQPSMR